MNFSNAPHKLTTWQALTLFLMRIASCQTTDSSGTGGAPLTANAIIYGKVIRSAHSKGVPDVRVVVYNSFDGCQDVFESDTREQDITNRDGKYRIFFRIAGPIADSCSVAQIRFPDSSKFISPESQKFEVNFRSEPPYDSVRVDFTVHDSTK